MRVANLKRGLLIERFPVFSETGEHSGKELVLINLHLEAYDNGEGKIAQTKVLRSLLDEEIEKGNYVIAGGDFNQSFSNIDISRYPKHEGMWECGNIDISEFSARCRFIMDNTVPTCRSLDRPYAGADREDFQYYMIDGFIISDNLDVISAETKDCHFTSSDHNPVVLQITLQP